MQSDALICNESDLDSGRQKGTTARIRKLRDLTIKIPESISGERAKLLTESYRLQTEKSIPIKRAESFRYILENKFIYIGDGELIVGERGEYPKATSTYPEICCHSIDDLNILDSRDKTPYLVADEIITSYKDTIIPFWEGLSVREQIFEEMDVKWKNSFEAGVFTEFMEQRAPGHTVLDEKIYSKGMLDFILDIEKALSLLDSNDSSKREQLLGMKIAAKAIIMYAKRYAEKLQKMADAESDILRKAELAELAEICLKIPASKPETFYEALQYYWFVHLGVIIELPTWDAFSPGKLDKHLYPFYKNDLESGILTEDKAKELLECFWIKFHNHPAPPKVGVTAQESSTYTDFAQINLGGVKSDGTDNVNELTYLLLDVIEEMRLVQPNASIQVSKRNPDAFIKRALKIIKTGFGQPSIFNTDAVIPELLRQGKSLEDARCGGTSGCVESGAFGKENYSLTGYFNLAKVFEIMLFNGIDPRTGKLIGLQTGNSESFTTFKELYSAFEVQLSYFINIKIKGNLAIERIYAEKSPSPFLSILIDDCIKSGKDYNAGGARYNTSYIQGVGTGTITDSMSAIKKHVFEDNTFSMKQIKNMLSTNFAGCESERLILLNKTVKYGNDEDYADDLMKDVFNSYFMLVDGKENYKGGHFRINMLPTTCHVYFGSVMIASPNGRFAFEPTSEGISPSQGADRNGPTAVIKSAAKMDHLRTGGTLLNVKFSPQMLANDTGISSLCNLVRSYFKMDGHHIQFNVIDAETLKRAKAEPEKYRDLIVRVAGYSDYFYHLGDKLQDEIIFRTEHDGF